MSNRRKALYHTIGAFTFMFIVSLGMYYGATKQIMNRNIDIVEDYTNQLSDITSGSVETLFADHSASIQTDAYLYGKALNGSGVDFAMLQKLNENTAFDYIRYVDASGNTYYEGKLLNNVSDREYYTRGIQGRSGIVGISESKITKERLLGFYAPVYYQTNVVGVLVGFVTDEHITEVLKTQMYEHDVATYIVMQDGTVIADSNPEGVSKISKVSEARIFLDEVNLKYLEKTIKNNDSGSFQTPGKKDVSLGVITPIKHTNWSLVLVSPPQALYGLNYTSGKEAAVFIVILAILYAVAVITTLVVNHRANLCEMKDRISRVQEEANFKLELIIAAAKTIYPFISLENLSRDEVSVAYNETGIGKKEISMSVDDYMKQVAATFSYQEDKDEFLRTHNLENLITLYENGEKLIYGRVRQKYPDGMRWMEYRSIFVAADDGDVYAVSMGRCIDLKVAREDELKEASIKAEAANKAKTMFLFNMSHDIRTPMNAVLGYAELAARHSHDQAKLQEYLANITVAGQDLLDIINNVLEMARIENDKLVVVDEPWELTEIVDRARVVFENEAKAKGIDYSVESSIFRSHILVDHTKLIKIIINLVSNAIKYTPNQGAVKLVINQKAAKDVDHCDIEIVCKDTGIGMSKEFQRHMFDNFSRERTSTDSKNNGTGLGLSIVKGTVDAMGGSIDVESSPGMGSTFTVTIPCRICYEDCDVKVNSSQHKELFRGKNILLAEDNDLNAEIAIEILKEEGINVVRARDGKECVEILEKSSTNEFDVILMDIQMPVMDGYEATKVIRQMYNKTKAHIPIIAMTANAFEEDRQNAYNSGMNGHIAKPIDLDNLFNTLAGNID